MLSTPCSGEGKNAVFDYLSTTYIQGEGEGLTPCDTTALLHDGDVVFSYVLQL